jgi:Mg2+ and Co2+ transporter CorA
LRIDLLEPTVEEELKVERDLGIDVPTREEMREIETSNRLYEEGDALYMTATVVPPSSTPIADERPDRLHLDARSAGSPIRYVDPLPAPTLRRLRRKTFGAMQRGAGDLGGPPRLDQSILLAATCWNASAPTWTPLSNEVFASQRQRPA